MQKAAPLDITEDAAAGGAELGAPGLAPRQAAPALGPGETSRRP